MNREELNNLSKKVVHACFEVHKQMGPALLETNYEQCLMREFYTKNISAKSQVPVRLDYKNFETSRDLKLDILVEDEIILELKSVNKMLPVFGAQIISYL